MNRIYKVIWSKVKHQYIVVSELAHRDGKQSKAERSSISGSLRAMVAALMVSGAVLVMPYTAWAAEPAIDENSTITIGADTTVEINEGSSIIMGGNWQGVGTSTFTMDTSNITLKNTDINFETDNRGNFSIYLGTKSTFSSTGASENNTVIGENGYLYKSSNNKIIGDNAYIGGSSNILAIGDNLKVKDLDKDGNFSSADSSNSVIYGNNNNLESSKNTIVIGNGNTVTGYSIDGYNGQNVLIGNDIYLGKVGNNAIKNEEVVAIGSDIQTSSGSNGAVLIGDGVHLKSGGSNSVTIGHDALGAANAVAIGANTQVQESNIAIGNNAIARGDENPNRPGTFYGAGNAIAIGEDTAATSGEAIAIGFQTKAASSGVAMGRDVTIGKSSSYATAIGGWNHIGDNSDYSVAIGGGPAGQDGKPDNGASIGDNSGYSVAIGTYSLIGDNVGQSVAMGYRANIGDGTAWSIAIGPTAVLGENVKQSAAYGYDSFISSNSTYSNAIGVRASIGSEEEDMGINYGNAIGSYANVSADYGNAIGSYAMANGEWATAVGSKSDANFQATAVGGNAQALAENSVAIGIDSNVAEGADYGVALSTTSKVTANDIFTADKLQEYTVTQGHNEAWNIKEADGIGVVSVGSDDGGARRVINVARGRVDATSTDAVNGSQLYALASEFDSKLDGAGGAWNLTTNANPADDVQTTIGKDNTVDFSGSVKQVQLGQNEETGEEITAEHQNIQVSQETQYQKDENGDFVLDEDGNKVVTGTNVTFDLNDRIVLGDSTEAYNQVILDGLTGSVYVGGLSGVSIAKDPAYGNGYIISGLANKEWTYTNYASGIYENSGKAATEAQLHDAFGYLDDKINSMEILPDDDNIHIEHPDHENPGSSTGTGSGDEGGTGTEPGTGTGDSGESGSSSNQNTHYVGLENDVTIGGRDDNGNNTFDPEEEGSFAVTKNDGSSITINHDFDNDGLGDGVINGMTNTTWDWNKYEEGGYATSSNAATEAQLHGAMEGAVQFDRNEDGTVNKGSITLNEGGTIIHNVAPGEISENSMDAVNGSQLWQTQQQVDNNTTAINNMGNQINRLGDRIDKVGAGAAALAALHPLDFDPDDKLSFAAGYGNYAGENAVAIGAFYQPNEDTLFSVGGTVGNDENMVNVGVSFKLGQKNHVSNNRVAMAKEIISLRDKIAQLEALLAHQGVLPQGQIDTSRLFPDVPENHWAYEYVHELAKLGIVEGYPDGNYDGDRMMTRYEMAAIIYRAMQKGVNVDRRMLTEFEPELKLIRVDVVAKDRDGNPTIERVRINEPEQQQA